MRAIDGTRVKEYLTCPRIPYLDFHGSQDRVLPATARMQILFESGRRVEEHILGQLDPVFVEFPRGAFEAGHAATLARMQARDPVIAEGVLKDGDLLGRPDLLLWNEDEQCYEVADIKSSQKVHTSAVLQVALYSHLLARVTPAPAPAPTHGTVIVRDATRYRFALDDVQATLEHVLMRLRSFREDAVDPGAHLTEMCEDCRYRDECQDLLSAADDLSCVPGLTRAQKQSLHGAGVERVSQLLEIESPADISRTTGLPRDLVHRLRVRAGAAQAGAPRRLATPRREIREAAVALAAILYERNQESVVAAAGLVFDQPDKFRVRFLREREAEDPQMAFFTLVKNLAGSRGPVLVFGSTVRRMLEEGLSLVPRAARLIEGILARLVDVRAEMRRTMALPGFDRSPSMAADSAGLKDGDGTALELEALRYLEEEDGVDKSAIERLLRHDLERIAALRAMLLEDVRW